MLIDLLGLAILTVFVLIGAMRGGVATGASLVTLLLAYAAAIVVGPAYGEPFAAALGAPVLLGTPLVGSLAFLATFVLCGLIAKGLRSWDRRRRGDLPRGSVDRFMGGLFGGIRGGLVVLLVTWLVIWLDAGRELGTVQGLDAVPETEHSHLAALTGNVVERAVEAALSDGPAGRVAARMAARPAEALRSAQALLEDRRIQAIQNDRFFWTLVENGATERALNQQSFRSVIYDDQLRLELAELGFISEEAAADPQLFRESARSMLDEVGPRLRGLSNDPELQALVDDPEIQSALQSGDTLALLGHPGIQRLVDKVSGGP